MTTGALIFAYNNENIDYLSLAAWSADNIHRHLGIPVAVVTDIEPQHSNAFDRVIINHRRSDPSTRVFSDAGQVTWHNTNRMDAYALSPWDQTLLLDADYVVASSDLKILFDIDQDLIAPRWAYDVTSQSDANTFNCFGQYYMPMTWATVVLFRKSRRAQLIFDAMAMVRDNWSHYRALYRTGNSVYRNDHALAIAQGIVNGHTIDHASIPWAMASVVHEHTLTQLGSDHYRVDYVNGENQRRYIEIKDQDFHAMGKKHLGDIVANSHA